MLVIINMASSPNFASNIKGEGQFQSYHFLIAFSKALIFEYFYHLEQKIVRHEASYIEYFVSSKIRYKMDGARSLLTNIPVVTVCRFLMFIVRDLSVSKSFSKDVLSLQIICKRLSCK